MSCQARALARLTPLWRARAGSVRRPRSSGGCAVMVRGERCLGGCQVGLARRRQKMPGHVAAMLRGAGYVLTGGGPGLPNPQCPLGALQHSPRPPLAHHTGKLQRSTLALVAGALQPACCRCLPAPAPPGSPARGCRRWGMRAISRACAGARPGAGGGLSSAPGGRRVCSASGTQHQVVQCGAQAPAQVQAAGRAVRQAAGGCAVRQAPSTRLCSAVRRRLPRCRRRAEQCARRQADVQCVRCPAPGCAVRFIS